MKKQFSIILILFILVSSCGGDTESNDKTENNLSKEQKKFNIKVQNKEAINIEEVFEEGAVPENIEENTDDSSEETEDQNIEEINNEINSISNDSENQEDVSS